MNIFSFFSPISTLQSRRWAILLKYDGWQLFFRLNGAEMWRLHIVGLSGKNPPEIKFEESVKLSNFTYVCNTFAKFLTFLIYSKPKYWELVGKFMKSHQTSWIYFWRVLSIWNHCDTGSRRYAWEFGNKPHLSNCSTLTCSQRNLSHAFFLSNRCVYQTLRIEVNFEGA